MDNRWDQHKNTLIDLYFCKRKSLDPIKEYMSNAHDFHAT
jgi:hypothetical protein